VLSRLTRGTAAVLAFTAFGVTGCHRSPTAARSASPGEGIFQGRCSLCHSTGEDNRQGPGLAGVIGRKAGSANGFAYTSALKQSNLTWDRATLDRFLSAPGLMVPGTAMATATTSAGEREALIDYLSTLVPEAQRSHAASGAEGMPRPAPPRLLIGAAAFGDYTMDGPGVRRHFTADDLPAPFATPSSRNGPNVVPPPAGAWPFVKPGFVVDRFATGLENPRAMRVAPNGDIFLAETAAGTIRILRAKDGAKAAETVETYASSLDKPFGMAFYPPGPNPTWLYVANLNAVVRFPYKAGDLKASAPAETIVPSLTVSEEGHSTRDLAFSKDGGEMFVSVGSGSNVAETMPTRTPQGIHDWEAGHGLGATWGDEENRADVLVFTPNGKNGHVFASGIRNCVGLAVSPESGDVWCSTNERDGLGDNLVPDYITRVKPGGFYGWPWVYLGEHVDPRHDKERTDLAGKVTVPDVLLQAHSASLQMTFYEGAMFPADYRGNVFAALHGSWNRKSRTGPKVIRVPLANGVPTGEYEDFMTGFVVNEDAVWGRPVGVTVAHDGALLVSEDGNGTVWRVSTAPGSPTPAAPTAPTTNDAAQ
jgi:glucose/arabinose dehydrogenase/cytochrome c2